MAGVGAGAAAGGGAEVVLVGAEAGVAAGADPVADEIEPSSRETSFGGAVFPEKNSAAVRAGSAEGAGG